ncbi:TetR/AcrR family transcriptional regulator [Pseudonocardia kunmingensis]|uniref:TetR family transcriptional regulator n=1 Tax=Pseudonocardia kunmingensis TaxID=630975 RepID=A0A543D984_9PSEU|nr:TetR/AcrR family transcriptional regulator [Pseudonocardia kunmingensis]TQM05893.1 TetR family transcriptional regulator [Pseudonocardia kunmingensis]
MPRRPREHLDARRRQILDAARRCFIRNGFHATSMQDVLAEAELSVGAVYRYFASKDDIIAAIAGEALADVARAFDAHDAEEPPGLDDIVDLVLAVEKPPLAGSPESARLLVQIWSEALRSPELAAQLADVMGATRAVLGGLVARHQSRGLLPGDVSAEQVADVLIALVDGFMVQRAVHGHADPVAFRDGLRALMSGRSGLG